MSAVFFIFDEIPLPPETELGPTAIDSNEGLCLFRVSAEVDLNGVGVLRGLRIRGSTSGVLGGFEPEVVDVGGCTRVTFWACLFSLGKLFSASLSSELRGTMDLREGKGGGGGPRCPWGP